MSEETSGLLAWLRAAVPSLSAPVNTEGIPSSHKSILRYETYRKVLIAIAGTVASTDRI